VAHRCLLLITCFALSVCVSTSRAQPQTGPTPQFGIVPTGSYESYHVDAVNMQNGIDIIKIPLFSLPQLGKLSLGFSAVSNTTYWQPTYSCSFDGFDCTYAYSAVSPTYGQAISPGTDPVQIGPNIVPDNFPTVSTIPFVSSQAYCGQGSQPSYCYSTYYNVYDSTGGSHSMYYNSTNVSQLRTTDGSGFLYLSGVPDPSKRGAIEQPPATAVLIDSHGIKNTFDASGTSVVQSDPNNNSISVTDAGYTDSVGRVIPFIPQATSSITGCPNLGQAYQPAVSSSTWTVPGPNNSPATYTICYANIAYHTCFLPDNNCQSQTINYYSDGENHSLTYQEAIGTYTAIQSIVLPDGSYWGFVYDAANPSDDRSIAYGTVTKLITPEGGSIAYGYQYQGTNFCNPGGFPSTILSTRTVSDANGNSYLWNYALGGSINTVTDANQNDTVYEYQVAPWNGNNTCTALLEKSRKQYQGTGANGRLLRTVATAYASTAEPVPAENEAFVGYGNALPQTVTTTLDTGISTITTTGSYGGSFSAIMPTCGLFYDFSTSKWRCDPVSSNLLGPPVNLTLSIPTARSITDYSSSTLNSTSTIFRWQSQSNQPNYQDYFDANLLDTPSIVTISDGSNQVAQTTTIYDDPSYSSGTIAGHPTSVSQWNNNGSPIQTHTSWTTHGMVDHTVDARNISNVQYTYNFRAYGSQYINLYPSSIANALGQTTTYTWDPNTGKIASSTDPNNVLTKYFYQDPRGRVTQIQKAVGTSAENWTAYSYPSPITVNVAQDQTTKDDQAMKWSSTADGLGRVVQQIAPSGSIVNTNYDGLDQVISVSNPYFTSGSATDLTSYAYDALGRKQLQCQPDDTTPHAVCDNTTKGNSFLQWVYNGAVTTSTDENGNSWSRATDALGRLTSVTEPGSLLTTYQYNALNNLSCVDQWASGTQGQPCTSSLVRRFNFDSLSRLNTSTNPETGSISYSYTVGGSLCAGDVSLPCSKTDARLVTVNFGYDAVNRLTTKWFSGQNATSTAIAAATASSCYQYDTSTLAAGSGNFVGRLTSEWTQSGACPASVPAAGYKTMRSILAYDPMGRVKTEQQCNLGTCTTNLPYTAASTYDLAGNELTYTNGLQSLSFTKTYDHAGQLQTAIRDAFSNTPEDPLISVGNYSPAGAIQNMTLGFETVVTKAYDSRLRPTIETAVHP
jgi:YD repeat-containing protein